MYRATIAPIRRMPPEIMVDVFQYCVSPPTEDSACDPDGMRWTLARVCNLWNRIIHDTPVLWTTIVVIPTDTPNAASILEGHIRRACNLPLFVVIDEYRNTAKTTLLNAHLLAILFASSPQWQLLHISLSSACVLDVMSHLLPCGLPALEEAVIHSGSDGTLGCPGCGADDTMQQGKAYQWFENFTGLRRLHLQSLPHGLDLRWPLSIDHLSNWVVINDKRSQSDNLQRILNIENLEEWHVMILFPPVRHSLQTPLLHTKLRILRGITPVLLCDLTLPSLEQLTFRPPSHLPDGDPVDEDAHKSCWEDFANFLSRSKCRLTQLVALDANITMDPRFLAQTIQQLSDSLVEFGFCIDRAPAPMSIATNILQALTHTSKSAGLLPDLLALVVALHEDVVHWVDNDILVELGVLLKSRRSKEMAATWQVPALREVTVNFQDANCYQSIWLRYLRKLSAEGLRVIPPTRRAIQSANVPYWAGSWRDRQRELSH
ncbi:hypothetical protein CYLTODRAFT_493510 [Cylindrobasidium torrendii FP15055 ss-10]|uniref:F-box domain-containing protein n=1 Tax=Cylindrobasidium torrendii FP15055 ss-10 TaxID=1314674 RepID=A0A0D7B1D4_9AGAR|nr:hypothetical protein CYLTODRAFT_493510 [Cylindrobasidium torrendii FP15055 ss-10]